MHEFIQFFRQVPDFSRRLRQMDIGLGCCKVRSDSGDFRGFGVPGRADHVQNRSWTNCLCFVMVFDRGQPHIWIYLLWNDSKRTFRRLWFRKRHEPLKIGKFAATCVGFCSILRTASDLRLSRPLEALKLCSKVLRFFGN